MAESCSKERITQMRFLKNTLKIVLRIRIMNKRIKELNNGTGKLV
jgi:hypothetical protein